MQTGHHHSFRGPKKSALSVIQFVVSCRLTFRIFPFECDFICDVFICCASHLPLPSHTTHSVGRFEQKHKGLVAINVFEPDDVFNDKGTVPIKSVRSTKVRDAKYNIDLLRIYDENGKYHYVYVKSKSRLLNKQYSKDGHQKEFCHYCHQAFGSKRVLEKHLEKGCLAVDGQKFTLPEKGSYIEFDKHNTKLKCPYVIYGDFECLTTKSEQNKGLKGSYQEHKPCGFMLNVVSSLEKTSTPYLYRGEDCMDKFVEALSQIKNEIFEKMK